MRKALTIGVVVLSVLAAVLLWGLFRTAPKLSSDGIGDRKAGQPIRIHSYDEPPPGEAQK